MSLFHEKPQTYKRKAVKLGLALHSFRTAVFFNIEIIKIRKMKRKNDKKHVKFIREHCTYISGVSAGDVIYSKNLL